MNRLPDLDRMMEWTNGREPVFSIENDKMAGYRHSMLPGVERWPEYELEYPCRDGGRVGFGRIDLNIPNGGEIISSSFELCHYATAVDDWESADRQQLWVWIRKEGTTEAAAGVTFVHPVLSVLNEKPHPLIWEADKVDTFKFRRCGLATSLYAYVVAQGYKVRQSCEALNDPEGGGGDDLWDRLHPGFDSNSRRLPAIIIKRDTRTLRALIERFGPSSDGIAVKVAHPLGRGVVGVRLDKPSQTRDE